MGLGAVILTIALISTLGIVAFRLLRTQAHPTLESVTTSLQEIQQRVDSLLAKHSYARESTRHLLADAASRVLKPTSTLNWLFFATPDQKKAAREVRAFVIDSKRLVAEANEVFLATEIPKFKEFFDEVESNPLTPAQRRSCVVAEDRNLVLAGAGTGKTSTMIGRAGYLLASKRARPDQLLMLAYAKKAAEEMQERQDLCLERWLDTCSPTIKTFHALGLQIIGEVEGRRPALSPLAEDTILLGKFISEAIDQFCKEPEYSAMVIRYCGSEKFPYRNPFDFLSMAEYQQYIRTNELRTLKGERVKSFEECVIANFLSANSVEYEYERAYEVDTSGPDYRRYKPDFFLPDSGVYLEHFALDRDGNPPPHFDREKYLTGIDWKRALHLKHDTKLVETYSYLKREDRLESTIAEILQGVGVELRPKSNEELLEELRSAFEINDLALLLTDYLALFKQSDHDREELLGCASRDIDSSRLLLLLEIFNPILDAYEAELAAAGEIDFADMIHRAKEHVESGLYKSPYIHVLVDEFQDISRARGKLLSALVKQCPETVLFAVGDDWQAIYRFAGSDIGYTREFQKYFGPTATTPLDLTFRFNDKIGNAASQFVLKNPSQIRKEIRSQAKSSLPAISMVRVIRVADGLNIALDAIDNRTHKRQERITTVLVLSRFHFVVDEWRSRTAKRSLEESYPALSIEFMTVHAAKGKEADYVVVLGLGKGRYGFPSEKPTNTLLEFLLPEKEPFPLSEERRLFYVALTRSRQRVYLAYNPMEASQFVLELLNEDEEYAVCRDEFSSKLVCPELPYLPCPKCDTGALVPRTGPYGAFVGCNNFPYCKHVERPCPQCGGLMGVAGQWRECVTPGCEAALPICPRCGGEMVERNGPYGKFWGCINYRPNADFMCMHTINISSRLR